MTCEHLRDVERAILAGGFRESSRGQAWSLNCREWVYFECFIDTSAVRRAFELPACVQDHTHRGTHDGSEHGLVCESCNDALMGFVEPTPGMSVFTGAPKPSNDPR